MSATQDAINVAAMYALFEGPQVIPGEVNVVDMSVSGLPTADWDSSDTADTGIPFIPSTILQDSNTGILYICEDATPGAAVWNIIPQQPFV